MFKRLGGEESVDPGRHRELLQWAVAQMPGLPPVHGGIDLLTNEARRIAFIEASNVARECAQPLISGLDVVIAAARDQRSQLSIEGADMDLVIAALLRENTAAPRQDFAGGAAGDLSEAIETLWRRTTAETTNLELCRSSIPLQELIGVLLADSQSKATRCLDALGLRGRELRLILKIE